MSSYFETLNRRLRDVTVIAVQQPAPQRPAAPVLKPRPLPSGYATLREKLLALANGRPLRAIVFSGCSGGEGCTQVVREFAELLAGMGLNVLRIDAGAPSGTQGADLPAPPPAAPFGKGFLTVMASPAAGPDKERFLRAPVFASWLEEQRQAYDYVLIDAPPLLRFADGSLMGRLADGMVIVVQSEGTGTAALGDARDQLRRAEVNVLGVVLNRERDPLPPLLRPYLAFLRD